jgi:hypothetical protein
VRASLVALAGEDDLVVASLEAEVELFVFGAFVDLEHVPIVTTDEWAIKLRFREPPTLSICDPT